MLVLVSNALVVLLVMIVLDESALSDVLDIHFIIVCFFLHVLYTLRVPIILFDIELFFLCMFPKLLLSRKDKFHFLLFKDSCPIMSHI